MCAIDFGDGIACKNTCEEKAKDTARLISTNINTQKGLKTGKFIGPSFAILMGIIFITWGWYCDEMSGFTGMLGIVFFVIGILQLAYNIKYIKPMNDKNS
ncbi:MAG: hypothetical protein OEV42_04800 [Deltaproteobacteria bacterium]|nr:hypothetical protein [Deltaproteobacteria bacterium]